MIDINDEYFDEESMNIEGFDIIGHGNDTIEEWEDNPVGKAVEALDNLLNKGDGAGYYAADWKVIYNKVPELKRLAQGQHYYESIEDLLQDIPKINSESHCWGGRFSREKWLLLHISSSLWRTDRLNRSLATPDKSHASIFG